MAEADLDLALPRPRPRRPPPPRRIIGAAAPAPQGGLARMFSGLSLNVSLVLAGFVMFALHMFMTTEEFSPLSRFLFVVPGVLLLIEIFRYVRHRRDKRELPFGIIGMAYYYGAFSVASFFHFDFFDRGGVVHFSDGARVSASVAVAAGALSVWAGMAAGERLGTRLQGPLLRAMPPPQLGEGYHRVVLIYAVIAIAFAFIYMANPLFVPPGLGQFVAVTISFDLILGLTVVRPLMFPGKWGSRVAGLSVLLAASMGLLRGMMEPLFRQGVAFLGASWAYARAVRVVFVVVAAAAYFVIQPAKPEFRAQVWHVGEQAGPTERVAAWGTALVTFWSGEGTQDVAADIAVSRLSELDAVIHAFDMIPGQVRTLDGSGWVHILSSPVPRLLWPNKPTTGETQQRYGVEFGRQTEKSALTTAFNMPLLVDGYWNFGWPGIVVASFLVGLWLGVCQRMLCGGHWALEAMGVALLSRLTVHGPIAQIYAGLFQNVVGLLITFWAISWGATLLSTGAPPGTSVPQIGVRRPRGGRVSALEPAG